MKKYAAGITMMMLLAFTMTAAAMQFYNQSGVAIAKSDSVKCGDGLTCAKTSGKIEISVEGDGTDTLYGFRQSQVAATATTATIAQCGKTFINAGGAIVLTLPEASTALGCRYTFICGDANDFDINPNDGTDVIGPISTTNGTTGVVTLAPSAGDAVRCTDKGGSLTLEATGADYWSQVGGGNGIWTDVN